MTVEQLIRGLQESLAAKTIGPRTRVKFRDTAGKGRDADAAFWLFRCQDDVIVLNEDIY